MNKLTFIPITGIPEIKSGDNIPKIINKGLNTNKIRKKTTIKRVPIIPASLRSSR